MATSAATAASAAAPKETGGWDLSFVSAPPEDLVCSICLSVHREPVLTSCCGNHFCFSCVEQVRLEQRPCPLCGALHFTTMLDKYFVRKVNELEVRCKFSKSGCSWCGSVSELQRHLEGDCKFIRIECPYFCGTLLVSSELEQHQRVCQRRPYVCKFCDYKGVYEDMSSKHWKVCEKYPLPCPSQCGEVGIERGMMDKHLDEECPLHLKRCEFEYAGCKHRSNGSDMLEHMANSVQQHLLLLAGHCRQLTDSFSKQFQSRMEEQIQATDSKLKLLQVNLKASRDKVSLLESKVESLEDEIDDLKIENASIKSVVFIPPFQFIMLGFRKHTETQQQWLSPPFYSHFGGYRMCIGIDASGSEEGNQTHVSVYANLMKGDYDDYLKWPFKGCITIELCNQKGPTGNLKEEIVFTYDASEIARRVVGGDIAEHGLGIPTFVEHTQLGYHTRNGVEIQYLKNDCLKFRVLRVDLMDRRNTGSFRK